MIRRIMHKLLMERFHIQSRGRITRRIVILCLISVTIFFMPRPAIVRADDEGPPAKPVKLVFIHHSCGENWLSDGHGGLGKALGDNNYFVSDTNYGWGPNCIGDRTDIVNWPEWFTGPESAKSLEALYKESEKHSPYTRPITDHGGENRIVMFKSCFPNSDLHGKPADPPARGNGLTVSNAKAIYNELLKYFSARPDKLFVVVTAPPVRDPAHAANARAFNTWLVRDWLKNYKDSNVAVFDFYNVLTGPNNHHRVRNGAIEYVTNRMGNTLYYPTDGDDHPSPAGNRKATGEFVPLLNSYYHRWKKGAPDAPLPSPEAAPVSKPVAMAEEPKPAAKEKPREAPKTEAPSAPSVAGGVIDDFEGGVDKWAVFRDEGKETRLTFARDKGVSYSGTSGLRIEYDVAPASWASCSLVNPIPRNWRDGRGLTVYLRAEKAGQLVTIIAYGGNSSDNLSHFEFTTRTSREAVSGWQRVDIPWARFVEPSWQGDGTARFNPAKAMGIAFAFTAPPGKRNTGRLWIDDITFLSAIPPP